MRPRSRIQTTGQNNGHQLWDNSKSSNRSENRPLICRPLICDGGVYKVFEREGGNLKRIGTADENLNIFKK